MVGSNRALLNLQLCQGRSEQFSRCLENLKYLRNPKPIVLTLDFRTGRTHLSLCICKGEYFMYYYFASFLTHVLKSENSI